MINSNDTDMSLIFPIQEELQAYQGFSSVTISVDRGYVDTPQGLVGLNPRLVLAINLFNPPATWKQDISCIVVELDGWQLEGIEVPSFTASREGVLIESMFLFSKINEN